MSVKKMLLKCSVQPQVRAFEYNDLLRFVQQNFMCDLG